MTISEILNFLDSKGIQYDFKGDSQTDIEGYSSLKNYRQNTFTWAKNEKAYDFDFSDKLLVIAQKGLQIKAKNIIETEQSKLAFFSLIEYMAEPATDASQQRGSMIGSGTIIDDSVVLGDNVIIGCNCVIKGNVFIGDGSKIWHNVTIMNNVKIGKGCEIQSGCVIGHDGFAWNENDLHEKSMIRHFGGVEIDDHVYIGPNCVIDRGEIDNTKIKSGAKIDANCFIAHNVIVGNNVIMITGSKLYGSVELGDNAYIASATVRNQCKVGTNTFVGIGAVVVKDIPSDVVAVGVPAKVMEKGKER